MLLKEETLNSKKIFSGKVFEVHCDNVRLSNGDNAFREVVEHPGGVCVAAVDSDRNIYLVEQFRYPFKETTIEVAAGKLEIGEDPFEAAVRELSEETGLSAENILKVGTFYPSPGYCSEKLHLYLATFLSEGEKHPDEGELLNCLKMPLSEAVDMVLSDEIADGKTKTLILIADRMV